ncbi:unnamed protein product [Diatraea saccharalis]|uniref:Chitin-binding type-2 domain-containing protein n=1 Tax=Diatraea saccharalis TaxID=40085 RepID=A0A9N9QYZ3_9NEOP|nr:unnamed protein product [Diatraea saccharalis]
MWLKIVIICVFGCTSTLTSSFDLGGVISGNRMAAVPLGMTLGNGELDVEGICAEPGFACLNCTHAITCVPLPVGYLKVPLQECSNGQTCNAHLSQCSDQHVPECQDITQKYKHVCEQVGIFPDAHDCRKFHLCSPPEGSPLGRPADHRTALCPRHYGYNPSTAQCSIKLRKGQCSTKLVPECTAIRQNGVLPLSPNHYYVCLSRKGHLVPQIFLCPHGWIFRDGYCYSMPQNTDRTDTNQDSATNKDIEKLTEKNEETTTEAAVEESSTAPTTSRIESFFSTEKSTTFAPDAFLADKFDLTNYESTDDMAPKTNSNNYDYANSYENFWN